MVEKRNEPVRTDVRQNRARIIEVAREALAASSDASLNSIAKKAGVGPGTLYRHFSPGCCAPAGTTAASGRVSTRTTYCWCWAFCGGSARARTARRGPHACSTWWWTACAGCRCGDQVAG